MAISFTLTPFSNAITATVTGLDQESNLVWYLDGKEFATEMVDGSADTHTFTLAPVYFASQHTVKLVVYREGESIFSKAAQTSTLYADIPLWDWTASNGQATASQTATAHEAATTQGLVVNYSHLVWDDFVRLLKDALDEVGLPWLNTHGSYGNTLVGEIYGSLTAQRFNAVVQNIRYPYWTWESLPGSYGYLGRQAVRKGDTVFGLYMTELAKYLNVVLGIYNGTANTSDSQAQMEAAIIHDAIAQSRHSAPMLHTSNLLLSQNVVADYSPSERLQGADIVGHLAMASMYVLRKIGIVAGVSNYVRTRGELTGIKSASVFGSYTVGSSVEGSLSVVRPVMTGGVATARTESTGTVASGRPHYAHGDSNILSIGFGNIEQKTPDKISGHSSDVAEAFATISRFTPLYLFGSSGMMAVASGQLGDTPNDPNWTYPKQSGNLLYIVQSYHTDRISDGIRIAWKPTVKTDSGIYIPQVFHADQNNDTLSIVYYSPVRTEDTLYIRQMNETLKGV